MITSFPDDAEKNSSEGERDFGDAFDFFDHLIPIEKNASNSEDNLKENDYDEDDPYYHSPVDTSRVSDIFIYDDNGKLITDEEGERYDRQQALSRRWQRQSGGVLTRWDYFVTPTLHLETVGNWLSYPSVFEFPNSGTTSDGELSSPSFKGLFQINMLDTEAAALSYRARLMFGRDLAPHEWGELVGAPDGARIEVRALPDGILIEGHPETPVPVFLVVVERAQLGNAFLLYSRPAVHLIDPTVKTNPAVFRSWTPAMLARCARKCHDLGIEAILCETEGTSDTPDITGYQFWPTLGFDSAIIPRFADDWGKIPPLFRVPSVLDLYALPDGPEVWALGGTGRQMVFQTAPRSRSQNTLMAHLTSTPSTASSPSLDGLTPHDREWVQKQIPNGDMTTHFFHPFTEEFLREGGEEDPDAKTRRERINLWIAQRLSSTTP